MDSGSPPRERLERAFQGFEKASVHLEQGHSALRVEVESLRRRLLDAQRRLGTVLDSLRTGVAVVSAEGEILRANRAFEGMHLVEPRGRMIDPVVLQRLHGQAGGGVARLRRRTVDGDRDLAVTVVPVGDETETRVLNVQDITDIRRQEEEGGRRRRLEALGRMAAELAHEVRNPLGSIRLFATMLRDEIGDGEQREMAEHILDASGSLEGTVSNLLSFASPTRGTRRRVDLAQIARETCVLLRPTCEVRGVTLEGPDGNRSCTLSAEPEALRQVLLNIVGNALAATERGGRIRVRTERVADRIELEVEDNGKGITAEDLPRVFDPFFSRSDGGTGLGLSIVHGIVERYGGRIALESECGRGTRVRIELPERPSQETLDE
ncbi:MAG: hypothetical protein GY716_08620 [bacterium]|nr:hypothetical protein [bacterium]